MQLSIELYNNNSFLCYEIGIATAVAWLKRNFEMMFLDCWDFSFITGKPGNKRIGNLITMSQWNQETNLKHYHGIEIKENSYQLTRHELLDIIQSEIDTNRPLFVNRDFLITGYDEQKWIYGYDILAKKNVYGSLQQILPDIRNYITFELTGSEIRHIDPVFIVRHTLERIKSTMFAHIKEFAEIFFVAFECLTERGDIKNTNDIPLIERILDLSRGRRIFAMALRYVDAMNQTSCFHDAGTKLEAASDKWLLIMGLFEKLFYASSFQDSNKMKIYKYIKEAADFETEILKDFTILMNQYDIQGKNDGCDL